MNQIKKKYIKVKYNHKYETKINKEKLDEILLQLDEENKFLKDIILQPKRRQ